MCGCNNNRTRVVMFTENPPSLTTMTMTTTSYVDTFSEYMATYSVSETTEIGNGRQSVSRPQRVAADTVFDRNGIEQVSRDTAAEFTYVVTTEITSFSENSETTSETSVPESETENTETSVVETTVGTESGISAATIETVPQDTVFNDRPQRDTVFSTTVSADTVYSNETNTSNGGTSNAD